MTAFLAPGIPAPVPRYQELLEAEWDEILNWFKVQADAARRKNYMCCPPPVNYLKCSLFDMYARL